MRRYYEEQKQIDQRRKLQEKERALVLDQQLLAVQQFKEQQRQARIAEELAAQEHEAINRLMWQKEKEKERLRDLEREQQANARRSFARKTANW